MGTNAAYYKRKLEELKLKEAVQAARAALKKFQGKK